MKVQGTAEEVPAQMTDVCIYTRMDGKDVIWTLVIGEQRTKELSRDDICDMQDQLQAYIRQDGRDDLPLRTLSGTVALRRARVYSFSMECTSVLSHG